MKITAIHGGGDWADASVEYVVLPEGMDVRAEHAAYDEWYDNEYVPALRAGGSPKFISLSEWLILRGARATTPDELEIHWEGP